MDSLNLKSIFFKLVPLLTRSVRAGRNKVFVSLPVSSFRKRNTPEGRMGSERAQGHPNPSQFPAFPPPEGARERKIPFFRIKHFFFVSFPHHPLDIHSSTRLFIFLHFPSFTINFPSAVPLSPSSAGPTGNCPL